MKKQRPKISACLSVYNEEKRIVACLESLKDVVDEIIVVHDGPCSDDTLKLARRYTKKVFKTEGKASGSAEFIRQFSFEHASGDWILIIDPDEQLSTGLKDRLRRLVDARMVDAYAFSWPFYDEQGNRVEKRIQKYKKVLFRKSKMFSIGLPHMLADTFGKTQYSDLILEHYSPHGGKHVFRRDLRTNRKRARNAARILSGPLANISSYQTSWDAPFPQRNKLLFIRNHTLIAFFIMPVRSFLYWYILRGYWKGGWLGFVNALNIPVYYLFLSLHILLKPGSSYMPRALPSAVKVAIVGDCADWKQKNVAVPVEVKKLLRDVDIFIYNLECTLAKNAPKGVIRNPILRFLLRLVGKLQPTVQGTECLLPHLSLGKTNVACLANNHMCDGGAQGIHDTRQILNKHDHLMLGAGKDTIEAGNPLTLSVQNKKTIGIMNYNFIGWRFGPFYHDLFKATRDRAGVNSASWRKVRKQIAAFSKKVDYLITVVHIGKIWRSRLSRKEINFLESLPSDLVVVHHAHRSQEIESDKVFSTGDFIFGSSKMPSRPSNLLFVTASDSTSVKAVPLIIRKGKPYPADTAKGGVDA